MAILKWDKPLLVDDAGGGSTPAVVSFDPAGTRVGQSARKRAWSHPETTARGAKRVLGRSIDDAVVKAYGRNAPVASGPGARLGLGVNGKAGAPEAAVEAILAHLVKIAAEKLGSWPTSAVLSAPAWFGAPQRAALRTVAQEVGLAVSRVVSEPVAAAVQLVVPGGVERRVAVIDIGAGGIGAAVLVTGRADLRVLGEAATGIGAGDDFDGYLVTSAMDQLTQQIGFVVPLPATLELLRQVCEEMKIELSHAGTVTRVIPFLPNPVRGEPPPSLTFSRAQIESLVDDVVAGAVSCFRRALVSAQIEPSALDAVYLNGGMVKLAGLQAALQTAIGHRGAPGLDPIASPALGAAILAASLARQISPILFDDGTLAPSLRPPPRAASMVPAAVAAKEALSVAAPAPAPEPAPSIAPSPPLIPREVGGGTLVNPQGPRAVLGLPLARPMTPDDLEPIALPVLLVRVLGREHVSGTLTVTEAKRAFTLTVIEGMGYLRAHEHPALQHLFGWPRASYTFNPAPPDAARREKFAMPRLAMDGLRALARTFSETEMEGALGAKMDASPRLAASSAPTITELVSDKLENSFIARSFDGQKTARELVAASDVPHTTLRLLLLLTAFDALEWSPAGR